MLEKVILHRVGVGWLVLWMSYWRHILWRHEIFMNECHLNIYEWMHKFIRYYKNVVHSLTQTLRPFITLFILKIICKKKKLSLVTGTDGNFRLSGDWICSTSAEPWYCVNSPSQDQKIPSALVTGERFLYHSFSSYWIYFRLCSL